MLVRWLLIACVLLVATHATAGPSVQTPVKGGGAGGGAGSVAADAIFDALGDLPCGTGANTAERLPKGTDGQVLSTDSTATCDLRWIAAPGGGDVTQTGTQTLTNKTLNSADNVIHADTVAGYDNIIGAFTCVGLACSIETNAVDGTDINLAGEATGDLMYFDGTNWLPGVTEGECFPLFAPTATILDTYDVASVWRAPVAVTVTEVWCETNTGTVTMDVQIDDGTPADIMGADLVCDTTGETDSSSLTGTMAAGDRLDFAITSVATSPTRLTVCIKYTR